MQPLENVQGASNSRDVNALNTSPSNDQLQIGADALAKGRAAGFTDDETLAIYNRRAAIQSKGVHPVRKNIELDGELRQKIASIRAENPVEINDVGSKTREMRNDQIQFEADGRERDQSVEDAYFGRDENAFSVYDPKLGRNRDIYLAPGVKTGDENASLNRSIRREAENRSYGIREVPKVRNNQVITEPRLDRRGQPIIKKDGTPATKVVTEVEQTYKETGPGQGGTVRNTGGSAVGRNAQELAMKIELGLAQGTIQDTPEVRKTLFNLQRTADPGFAKQAEAAEARELVQADNANFSTQKRADVIEAERRMVDAAVLSGKLGTTGDTESIPYIPGGLTSAKTDPDTGIATKALRAESDARFNARPQAVPFDEESAEIARSLGISGYVDANTGDEIGVAPSKLQTNHPGTDVQINAPQSVTTAASWVGEHLRTGKTGDVLADTNMSQITSDFSRRVEAAAPGYRSRPVRTVQDFATQVQRVIDTRQAAGGNFYKPAVDAAGNPVLNAKGRQKQTKVSDPGISEVMRLLRFTSGEEGQLANALYTMETSGTGSRPVSSFSDGVSVNTGSMYGETLDVGVAGRDTQRAAFAKSGVRPDAPRFDEDGMPIDYGDAQRPQIGAIRERDEFGGVTREEPPLTRAVMKGRTPDEAVATYKAQRAKNNQPVDQAYAKKIFDDNASLRRDQEKTNIMNSLREANQTSTTGAPPARVQEDADFFAGTEKRNLQVSQMQEADERTELARLVTEGAQYGSESGLKPVVASDAATAALLKDHFDTGAGAVPGRDAGKADPGRKLVVPGYRDKSLVPGFTPQIGSSINLESETPGRAADLTGIRTTSGNTPTRSGRVATSATPAAPITGRTQVSEALRRQVAARVDQKRRDRRSKFLIGGGVGAGVAGIGALLSGLNDAYNGPREEQY